MALPGRSLLELDNDPSGGNKAKHKTVTRNPKKRQTQYLELVFLLRILQFSVGDARHHDFAATAC
jgi:hypothetical protein